MTSYSLEVLLAAMLGGRRDGDKLVHYRLLMFMYLLTIWMRSFRNYAMSIFVFNLACVAGVKMGGGRGGGREFGQKMEDQGGGGGKERLL